MTAIVCPIITILKNKKKYGKGLKYDKTITIILYGVSIRYWKKKISLMLSKLLSRYQWLMIQETHKR